VLIMCTNEFPRIQDRSNGVWRRLILIKFEKFIEQARRDHGLVGRLRGELPGILNWALLGLKRLYDNNLMTEVAQVTEWVNECQEAHNPALTFLKEGFESVPGSELRADDVRKEYNYYCKLNGLAELGARNFGKEITKCFPGVERVRRTMIAHGGGKIRYYAYTGLGRSSI